MSVIVPCYRAPALAADSVARLRAALNGSFESWEIVLVDDGSQSARPTLSEDANLRVIELPHNRGKGAAIRTGMLAARGSVRIFTDIDLPYGTDLITVIAHYVENRGFHVVIGDRTLPSSVYSSTTTPERRVASAIFSNFVGRVVTGGFFDTQCGLKGFRGDVAQHLFSLLRVERFAFDVELVYLCLKHRLDIKRIPVHLESSTTSSVRLWRDSLYGFTDVFRIKALQLKGQYDSVALDEIVQSDFAEFKSAVYAARSGII